MSHPCANVSIWRGGGFQTQSSAGSVTGILGAATVVALSTPLCPRCTDTAQTTGACIFTMRKLQPCPHRGCPLSLGVQWQPSISMHGHPRLNSTTRRVARRVLFSPCEARAMAGSHATRRRVAEAAAEVQQQVPEIEKVSASSAQQFTRVGTLQLHAEAYTDVMSQPV